MTSIDYELVVDSPEPDRRLELLHDNVRRFGTIFNTVAAACEITGAIRRTRYEESAERLPPAVIAGSAADDAF